MKKYAIICGSRSGSTYLCDLLSSTNRLGRPQEFFNKDMGFSKNKHEIIKKYKTENDVFGVKVVGITDQWESFIASGLQIDATIWLHREDIILQAISRYIAYTTDGWHKRKHKQSRSPKYDKEGISWCLEEIKKENNFYDKIFTSLPGDNIQIIYEQDIQENAEQTVYSILNHLEIGIEDLPKLPVKKQETSNLNLQWKEQFLKG